jgi:hypothetical protein
MRPFALSAMNKVPAGPTLDARARPAGALNLPMDEAGVGMLREWLVVKPGRSGVVCWLLSIL